MKVSTILAVIVTSNFNPFSVQTLTVATASAHGLQTNPTSTVLRSFKVCFRFCGINWRHPVISASWTEAQSCVVVDAAVMLEASAEDLSQADFQKCVKEGVKHTQPIVNTIKQLQQEHGKPKRELTAPTDALNADILEVLTRSVRCNIAFCVTMNFSLQAVRCQNCSCLIYRSHLFSIVSSIQKPTVLAGLKHTDTMPFK